MTACTAAHTHTHTVHSGLDQVLELYVCFSVFLSEFAQTGNGIDGVDALETRIVLEDRQHLLFAEGTVIAHVTEPTAARWRSSGRIAAEEVADFGIELFTAHGLWVELFGKDAVAETAAEKVLLPADGLHQGGGGLQHCR